MRHSRRVTWVTSWFVVLGLVLAACGDSDSDAGAESDPDTTEPGGEDSGGEVLEAGFVNGGGDTSGEPSEGGEITMGVFSEASSLDPVTSPGTGYAGGTEMAAIFDVLIRYNPETQEYEPQLAESLEPNDDNSVWTLTLRPDVTFSNGEVLDAEAVKISLERQAANGRSSFLYTDNISSVEVVDDLTVQIDLNKEWAGFPYVLAFHLGMITPPSADDAGEDFASNPVGAGPYELERYVPGEEIVLTAREDYWAGKPAVETLRFTYLAGAQASLDALESGTFQAAYLGEPQVAVQAMEAGTPGYLRINYAAGMTMLNTGWDPDRPTADVRVRRAVAHAVDPELMNERVWGGMAQPGTSLYGEGSRWATEVPGLEHDPDRAAELVEEAEADGWDGEIQVVASASPPWNNAGLALQAQLEAVGFSVDLVQPATVGDQLAAVNVDHDYDAAPTGYALDESEPYVELSKKFSSTSVTNAAGYKSDEMDSLLVDLAAAATDDAKIEVLGQVQELLNEDAPGPVWSHNPELLAWDDSVHGVRPTVNAMILFDQAWID